MIRRRRQLQITSTIYELGRHTPSSRLIAREREGRETGEGPPWPGSLRPVWGIVMDSLTETTVNLRAPNIPCKVYRQPNHHHRRNANALKGVMRFLQTEWHRHERERNAWDIERQEMKARIASLEGAGRKSNLTQVAAKKYITMLESKLKKERRQMKDMMSGLSDGNSEQLASSQQKPKQRRMRVKRV